jgi:tetratricopeptide (TPR) repeat protein
LEKLRSKIEPEAAAEIASHFEEGREYEKAILYLIVAAENATHRYAHRESVETLEHALKLLSKLTPELAREFDVQILERIGDSQYALGDMERSAATYHTMATHAAEAGLLTAQANALMRLAHSAEAIPFFLRAVELDPDFASAYVSLSRIYSNLGEVERANAYAKLAYEHREHVSERERLSIMYQYHYEVTGDQALATDALEVWKHSYPQEFQPPNSLAFLYNILGQFDRAIAEATEAVRRNPAHGFPYSNLAHAYRGAGCFDDARQTAERAVALNIETLPTRRLLYQLAVLSGDNAAAAGHLEWSRDKPREFEITGCRAQVAGCSGKLSEARRLYEETVRMAEFRNLGAVGTNHLAWASWMEMAYGNSDRAIQTARRVLNRNPSYDALLRVALVLTTTGFIDEAEAIVSELVIGNPDHTIINSILVPIVKAGISLRRHEPAEAIEQLRLVVPYELGFIAALAPIHLRGQSYLMQGEAQKAAEEFQRIRNHRGSDPFSPFYAAAQVGVARAFAMAGKLADSLEAYEQFFVEWSEADPDVPLLLQVREEYEHLSARKRSSAAKAQGEKQQ